MQGKGIRNPGEGGQNPLLVKVRPELRPEGHERVNQVAFLGKEHCRQREHMEQRLCGCERWWWFGPGVAVKVVRN